MSAAVAMVEGTRPNAGRCSWLMAVPVISTAHISVATEQMLEQLGDNHPYVHVAPYEFGWFISVLEEFDDLERNAKMPRDFVGLQRWARAQGYDWLRLDGSGDTIDGLPMFE